MKLGGHRRAGMERASCGPEGGPGHIGARSSLEPSCFMFSVMVRQSERTM